MQTDPAEIQRLVEWLREGAEHVAGHGLVEETERYEAVINLLARHGEAVGDMAAAAGELRVPMPEPGTDMAKLLSANVLMRAERDREKQRAEAAEKELADLRVAYARADDCAKRSQEAGYAAEARLGEAQELLRAHAQGAQKLAGDVLAMQAAKNAAVDDRVALLGLLAKARALTRDEIAVDDGTAEDWLREIDTALARSGGAEGEGWIACSERLPPKGDEVLAVEPYAKRAIVAYHYHGRWWKDAEDMTVNGDGTIDNPVDVIAWRPLPAPPRAGE